VLAIRAGNVPGMAATDLRFRTEPMLLRTPLGEALIFVIFPCQGGHFRFEFEMPGQTGQGDIVVGHRGYASLGRNVVIDFKVSGLRSTGNELSADIVAGFSAATAGGSALLAVVHGMARTFLRAGGTDLRAERTQSGGKVGITRKLAGGERANIGASAIEIEAARHHFDVILLETKAGAPFASGGAGPARIDADLMSILSNCRHVSGSWLKKRARVSSISDCALTRMSGTRARSHATLAFKGETMPASLRSPNSIRVLTVPKGR